MGTFANSKDPDKMQHNAAFHQGLRGLLRGKQPSGTEMHHYLENSTRDPLNYPIDSPIVIVSICMGNFIRLCSYRRCLLFGLNHYRIACFICANSEGSGENAQ